PVQVNRGNRINKRDFDLEHHENQSDQVEADVEIDPRVPGRRLAAFVGSQLSIVRVIRRQQTLQAEHHRHEADPDDRKRQRYAEIDIHFKLPSLHYLDWTGLSRRTASTAVDFV